MTAKFGMERASRQNARRECCKSCDLGPELGDVAEIAEHFLLTVLFTTPGTKAKAVGEADF